MKIIVCLCLVAGCAVAGPLVVRNVARENIRKADIAKAADPDASVKWADIKAEFDAVGTALDGVDFGSVTQTVFTGDQRIAVKNLKDNCQALKVAAKNLMQAGNKMVRKIKQETAIEEASK